MGGRCLVVLPTGGAAPAALLGALDQRGVEAVLFEDVAQVMVALARGEGAVVIQVRPGELARSGELARAIERYYPGVSVWGYAPSAGAEGMPELVDVVEAKTGETDGGVDWRRLLVKVPADRASAEPLVSEEELSMLLGPLNEERA